MSNMPQLLLSGQYFVAHTAYSLQRCEGKGQKERCAVSNRPTAALVRSVLCSDAPTPSPEMRGQWGRGSTTLCQIRPQLFLAGQYFVADHLFPLLRCAGMGAEGALLYVKYALSCSCQVSIMYHPASFPSRGVMARGQRECNSVSNTPPAALVKSVQCSGVPTLSS